MIGRCCVVECMTAFKSYLTLHNSFKPSEAMVPEKIQKWRCCPMDMTVAKTF